MTQNFNNNSGVVVFAYQNMGVIGLSCLMNKNINIIHVITHKDNPNHHVWWDSVAEFCSKNKLSFSFIEDSSHDEIFKLIHKFNIHCIFSFHYRRIIPDKILNLALHGGINLHCSPLPRYKGKAPVNWQIINGEILTGISLHYMTREIDSGDIIDIQKTEILDTDDIMSVNKKLEQIAIVLLDKNIPLIIEGQNNRFPQNLSESTYFGARKPADGEINWYNDSKVILNLIRAVTKPYPGAFTIIGDIKYIIWKASKLSISSAPPIRMNENYLVTQNKLYFKTLDGYIESNDFETITI